MLPVFSNVAAGMKEGFRSRDQGLIGIIYLAAAIMVVMVVSARYVVGAFFWNQPFRESGLYVLLLAVMMLYLVAIKALQVHHITSGNPDRARTLSTQVTVVVNAAMAALAYKIWFI